LIRKVEKSDYQQITNIYNEYIKNTIITFEEETVDSFEIGRRIESNPHTWLVWEESEEILGYAYSIQWKSRVAYRYSAETSIYLHNDHRGKGIGTMLYAELIDDLRQRDFHSVIGGIALPNDASISLHERLGFKKVAHFYQVGYKFNKWIDVAYWQLFL
jgi:phosphinothricin acetyltransferase